MGRRLSSAAANNAGTGHAANCELNYTPQQADGGGHRQGLAINAAFERSLEFWAPARARCPGHPAFLNSVPFSFVWGKAMWRFCSSAISSSALCLLLLAWSGAPTAPS